MLGAHQENANPNKYSILPTHCIEIQFKSDNKKGHDYSSKE